jgi:DNA-directed RNA polymerase subunit L
MIGIGRRGAPDVEAVVGDISMIAGVKQARYDAEHDEIRLNADLTLSNISPILRIIMDGDIAIREVAEEALSLETTFLALTGTDLRIDESV